MAPESMIEIQNKLKAQSGAASLGHHHEDHHHHFEHRAALKMSYPECVVRDVEFGLVPCYGLQDEAACTGCQFGDDIHCMWFQDEEKSLCIDWSRCIEYDVAGKKWEPIQCVGMDRQDCRHNEDCGCHWDNAIKSCQGFQ